MRIKRQIVVLSGIVFLVSVFGMTLFAAEEAPDNVPKAEQTESAEQADNEPAAGKTEDAGLEYLDQATEAKIGAANLDDLAKVIQLCDRAKKAGLSADNLEFCEQLKASSQMQRGLVLARVFIDDRSNSLPPDWEMLRHTALADLEEAVKTIPDNPQAFYCIARLNLLPRGDLDRGKKALDLTIEKAGNDDLEMKTKAILLKTLLEEDKEKRTQLFKEALQANPDSFVLLLAAASHFSEVGLSEDARKTLDQALELEPENPVALSDLLSLQKNSMKFDEALVTAEKLEKLLPDNVLVLAEKAEVLMALDKFDEALATLDAARAKDARNPHVLFTRAKLYLFKEDLDKAEEDVDILIKEELPPELQVRVALLKVDVASRKKKYDEALKILDRLTTMVMYPVPLEQKKIFILLEKKAGSRALALAEQMLERPKEEFKGDDYAQTLRTKGDVYLQLGKHYDAIKAYKDAMELIPEDPGLLNNYAWVLATSPFDLFRDGPLALELAKKAAEKTDYKFAHILSTLGAAYAENGDFEKAIEYANKAVEMAEKEKDDRINDLKKELESYKEKKPIREIHEEEDEVITEEEKPVETTDDTDLI